MRSRALRRYNLLSVLGTLGRFVSPDAPTILFLISTVQKKYIQASFLLVLEMHLLSA